MRWREMSLPGFEPGSGDPKVHDDRAVLYRPVNLMRGPTTTSNRSDIRESVEVVAGEEATPGCPSGAD